MSNHRRAPLVLGFPKSAAIMFYISLLGLGALIAPYDPAQGIGWEQTVAYALSMAPYALTLPILAIYLGKYDRETDDVLNVESLKVLGISMIGGALTVVIYSSDTGTAKNGPGLILASVVAVTTWSSVLTMLATTQNAWRDELLAESEPAG